MNSDDYFDDDLDSGILNQLDIIEAAHRPQPKCPPKQVSPQRPAPPPKQPRKLEADDSFVDLTLDLNESELQRIDAFVNDVYQGKAKFGTRPSIPSQASSSRGSLQTTLFGDIVPPTQSTSRPPNSARSPVKPNSRTAFGRQAPKTKQWDHTAFAKSGWKKPKASKEKGNAELDDSQEVEEVEFEQFPAPFISGMSFLPLPMKLKVDMLEAKHWIYPLNRPKRDYQFNIVKHSLFDNTLVALPTGLGKTFIAGVVMLNYYRWFPDGKVVFVAPTKPLVAQQVDACHQTCGIPGRDAVELTGNNPRAYRSQMWESKRVFYMTPQTLMNDLTTENCDPRDIILIVVDEAHKGTGDYAYAQVIRYMMAKNPYFRVLALTATPGSSQEAVQAIVDSLHISKIEIRDEGSLDLREYEIKQHIIRMTGEIVHFQQLLKTIMEGILKPLLAKGVIEPLDVVKMHPYRALATMQRISSQRSHPHKWALGALSKLGAMARAMGYLMEASARMCLNYLQEFVAEKGKDDDRQKGQKSALKSDTTFQKLLSELEGHRIRPGGFGMHPKMETLKLLLVQHFGSRMAEDIGDESAGGDTRAMVFVTYRECVDEIVDVLNEERPLLKVTRFIGQGFDKQGRKGFAQKEQLEVIKKFKSGEFNVLVSTSIGEEGLDIGEVDMIICYDAQKTPIRMLQRVGRTGRKRDGYVHVLLSEIREELNWDKAKDTYGELQKCIVRGDQLELYGDVPRLLPDHMRPQVLEKKMDIEEYVREELGRRKKPSVDDGDGESPVKKKKRKRNDDVDRNIPLGASKGFVSVADLLVKKKKPKTRKFDHTLVDDDSTDMELQTNLMDTGRSQSASATVDRNSKKRAPLRKTRTTGSEKKKTTASAPMKGKAKKSSTVTQSLCKGNDDLDDMEIECDIICEDDQKPVAASPELLTNRTSSDRFPATTSCPPKPDFNVVPTTPTPYQSPPLPSNSSGTRTGPTTLDSPVVLPKLTTPSAWSSPPKVITCEVIELTSSPSPFSSHPQSPLPNYLDPCEPNDERPMAHQSNPPYHSEHDHQDIGWLLDQDEDEDLDIRIISSSPAVPRVQRSPGFQRPVEDGSVVEMVEIGESSAKQNWQSSEMPAIQNGEGRNSPSGSSDIDIPDASFAVRPVGKRLQTRHTEPLEDECQFTSGVVSPPRRRLMRKDTETIPRTPTPALHPTKRKKPLISIRHNPWLDGEAEHSGDEVSDGSSHSDDDAESESDRLFLKDIPDTQVSPSYDQFHVYRQSLLTQPPGMQDLPAFANRPVRKGASAATREYSWRRPMMSSSPPRDDDEPNEYAFGSFVVADDADLSFD
ncbi:hypothetical protein J3A83DRAFT_4359291 [Scleroderma citrinum]